MAKRTKAELEKEVERLNAENALLKDVVTRLLAGPSTTIVMPPPPAPAPPCAPFIPQIVPNTAPPFVQPNTVPYVQPFFVNPPMLPQWPWDQTFITCANGGGNVGGGIH